MSATTTAPSRRMLRTAPEPALRFWVVAAETVAHPVRRPHRLRAEPAMQAER